MTSEEQVVIDAIRKMDGSANELTLESASRALGVQNFWDVLRSLEQQGLIERTGSMVKISTSPPATPVRKPEPPAIATPVKPGPATPALSNKLKPRRIAFLPMPKDRDEAIATLASRILTRIDQQTKLSEVYVSLNAKRYPGLWQPAVKLLVERKEIKIEKVNGCQVATSQPGLRYHSGRKLKELPHPYYREKPAKKKRRKREPTDWFQERRDQMNEGQHEFPRNTWQRVIRGGAYDQKL